MEAILKRVLGLGAKFGVNARILIQKVNVKSTFRQVGVDPDGASRYPYRLGKFIYVDFRLPFEWRRYLAMSRSLAGGYFKALGERGPRDEPLHVPKTMTGWGTGQDVLRFWVDAEAMAISLSQRKVDDLVNRLRTWLPGRKAATLKEVLVLAGKLHRATKDVIPPGRYFVRWLLQLSGLHLNGEELVSGGDAWGKAGRKAEAEWATGLTQEFMPNVAWWTWYCKEEAGKAKENFDTFL